ncbi:SPFH domain-containing protein [Corynebacterium sp.]|uniref:SPFH domain-containing protein n=1 Tax=Corynebacterium sp. TaxID=1720 RepID=UPI0026DBECFA|nr:SPFH domain-containing protein [Corynebacterium sp.]MDO5076879.1 SPFH domain-containing protein [Corynebacterium sp.]
MNKSIDIANAPDPVGHTGAAVALSEKPVWSAGAATTGVAIVVAVLLPALSLLGVIAATNATGTPSVGLIIVTVVTFLILSLVLSMVRIVNPGHALVVQFFGNYVGTSHRTGLSLVPPLCSTRRVSLRVRNFETGAIKVNDLNGNPVVIGAIVVWQIADTAKAMFAVENVNQFIYSQAESALRHVATTHPYDSSDAITNPSLSGSTDLVSTELANEVAARAALAGCEIIEARISALSFAPEIAQAMLQRQQAAAIVDARETIVEGAVSMVQTALEQLERRDIVDLDPERRAAMVSNLLVVLCSDTNTQPVVNTGSLYN